MYIFLSIYEEPKNYFFIRIYVSKTIVMNMGAASFSYKSQDNWAILFYWWIHFQLMFGKNCKWYKSCSITVINTSISYWCANYSKRSLLIRTFLNTQIFHFSYVHFFTNELNHKFISIINLMIWFICFDVQKIIFCWNLDHT